MASTAASKATAGTANGGEAPATNFFRPQDILILRHFSEVSYPFRNPDNKNAYEILREAIMLDMEVWSENAKSFSILAQKQAGSGIDFGGMAKMAKDWLNELSRFLATIVYMGSDDFAARAKAILEAEPGAGIDSYAMV